MVGKIFINIVLNPYQRVGIIDKVRFNSEKPRPNKYQRPSENVLQSIV